ncbi:MAG: SMI1/KNR4 family protein [Arenicella sp.]
MEKEYVIQKLAAKKALDPDLIGFGVEGHDYELRPTINEKSLARLENKFDLTLPEDYRHFIKNIGNGGAGPSYGLYSIEGAIMGRSSPPYKYRGRDRRKLASQKFIRPDETKEGEWTDEEGVLILCQHGCGHDDFLVLNGKDRGTVWSYIEWVGHMLPKLKEMPDSMYMNDIPQVDRPEAEKKWVNQVLSATSEEAMTFSDWYLSWLEKPPHILPNAKRSVKTKKCWFNFF